MINIRVSIPERFLDLINDHELDESDLIAAALDKFFNTDSGLNLNLALWQKYIEAKIIDVQVQLDEHRKISTDDTMVELDTDLRQRVRGEKSPLELVSSESIRLTSPLAQSQTVTNTSSALKRKSVIDELTDDFDLRL
jgi:hypothetical protein